jgi:hypothetical protein
MLLGTIGLSQTVTRSIIVGQGKVEILTEVVVLNRTLRHTPLIGLWVEKS